MAKLEALVLTLLVVSSTLTVDTYAAQLMPDLIIRASDLYDHDFSGSVIPGRIHLRISNGAANRGLGPLHIYGVNPPLTDSTQAVNQRIFFEDGNYVDRYAGTFVYHQLHGHIHFADWSQFRVRELLPGDSVGVILAEGEKTSFCVVDEDIFDATLPNFDPDGFYFSCGVPPGQLVVQGLSVGWIDVYDKSLPDQNIDVTDLPPGQYWLESEADPLNRLQESDETNNISRIKITIPIVEMDPYEPNEAIYMLTDRIVGGANSPVLGPVGPQTVIDSLNLHLSGDRDMFKFYCNHTGSAVDDFVRLDFPGSPNNLILALLDSAGAGLLTSSSGNNSRFLSLQGLNEGWYYLRVFAFSSGSNPYYKLTINPPSNQPPSITVNTPLAAGDTVLHGLDTYQVDWAYSDPENDLCWVSIYVNESRELDGNEMLLPASLNTPAQVGFHIINSAYVEPGTYWVHCSISDGGTVASSWSDGTVTFIEPTCCLGSLGNADCDNSGQVDIADLQALIDHLFINNQPLCCPDEGNLDGLGEVDISDLTLMIDHLFISLLPLGEC